MGWLGCARTDAESLLEGCAMQLQATHDRFARDTWLGWNVAALRPQPRGNK